MQQHEQEPHQVIADCSELIEANPSNVDARFKRGRAWYKTAEYAKAIVDLDVALHEDPDHAAARFIRGLAFSKQNKYDLAIMDFNKSIFCGLEEKCLPNCYFNRGRCHHLLGNHDQAKNDFTESIRLYPQHPDAYGMRGLAWEAAGNIPMAIADYNLAIKVDPQSADAYHNRGNTWVRLGKLRKGIADFTKALELDPDNAVTHTSRGVAWRRKGQYARALADYERALEIEPESPQRHLVLGGFLACCPKKQFRDGDRALEIMTKACELTHFKDASQLNLLAAAHAERGDFNSAITVLQTVLTLDTAEEDEQDARFCVQLYQAGEPWRLDAPNWWHRFK